MITALVAVIEMKNKGNSVNIAIGLLNRLRSPEFIISMLVAEEILKITNSLFEQLQGIQLIIGNACSLMPGRHLLSFDSDSWDIYFETPGKYKYIDIYL